MRQRCEDRLLLWMDYDRLDIFAVVKDGCDRHVVHNKEEDRWVQVNGAQEFHGPHPDYGQPTQEVEEQQGA